MLSASVAREGILFFFKNMPLIKNVTYKLRKMTGKEMKMWLLLRTMQALSNIAMAVGRI